MKLESLSVLSARAQSLNVITRSAHAKTIPPASAAAAMAGLSQAAMELAMYRYVGDTGPQHALFYLAYQRAIDVANREKWRPPKGGELIRKMARVALFEAIEGPVCGYCHGSGIKSGRPCHHCADGRVDMPAAQIARALKMPESTFRKPWHGRYQSIRGEIVRFVGELNDEARFKVRKW